LKRQVFSNAILAVAVLVGSALEQGAADGWAANFSVGEGVTGKVFLHS
jgi:hypothetical protein